MLISWSQHMYPVSILATSRDAVHVHALIMPTQQDRP